MWEFRGGGPFWFSRPPELTTAFPPRARIESFVGLTFDSPLKGNPDKFRIRGELRVESQTSGLLPTWCPAKVFLARPGAPGWRAIA